MLHYTYYKYNSLLQEVQDEAFYLLAFYVLAIEFYQSKESVSYTFVMKLAKYLVRKSLLAFGYPKLETANPEVSIYRVGAIKVRMAPELPACQIFYPVEYKNENKYKNKNDFVPYFRKEAADGLITYLNGFGDGILQMLEEKPHPLQDTYAMDPLVITTTNTNSSDNNNSDHDDHDDSTTTTEAATTNKFPLVLFSHGLSGSMEMYSQICSQLASTGCVVVAVEHEDGSASYSARVLPDGTVQSVPYKRLLEVPYSRQLEIDFRTPMLKHRVDECRRIYDYFWAETGAGSATGTGTGAKSLVSSGESSSSSSVLVRKILSVTDPTKLHLVGHSFGGATLLQAAQTWITEGNNRQQQNLAPVTATASAAVASTKSPSAQACASTNGASNGGASTTTMTAATTTTTLDIDNACSSTPPPPMFQSVTVFDAWNFPLPDQVLDKGIPIPNPSNPICSTTISNEYDGNGNVDGRCNSNNNDNNSNIAPPTVISVLSEEWGANEKTLQFLRNCPPGTVYSYKARHSVHQSVCDTQSYLPSVAARKLMSRGPLEKRHRTINAVVEEFVRRTKRSSNGCINDNGRSGDSSSNNNRDKDNDILTELPFQ